MGVVLGSGLGAVADAVEDPSSWPTRSCPAFRGRPCPDMPGQAVLGTIGGVRVAVFQGRAHLYRAEIPRTLRVPVRALRRPAASVLVLTNAAGSLRPEVGPGG